MESLYRKHRLQLLSKLAVSTKRQNSIPQISLNLSKMRQRFQDKKISGKFLDFAFNHLLAISPADVTGPESVSAAGKNLPRNISITQ